MCCKINKKYRKQVINIIFYQKAQFMPSKREYSRFEPDDESITPVFVSLYSVRPSPVIYDRLNTKREHP